MITEHVRQQLIAQVCAALLAYKRERYENLRPTTLKPLPAKQGLYDHEDLSDDGINLAVDDAMGIANRLLEPDCEQTVRIAVTVCVGLLAAPSFYDSKDSSYNDALITNTMRITGRIQGRSLGPQATKS